MVCLAGMVMTVCLVQWDPRARMVSMVRKDLLEHLVYLDHRVHLVHLDQEEGLEIRGLMDLWDHPELLDLQAKMEAMVHQDLLDLQVQIISTCQVTMKIFQV